MKPRITIAALTLAAFLGAGAMAGCSHAGQNTPAGQNASDSNQVGSDGWITTKVKAELATTAGVSSTDISVTTTNGVVTLTGVLANDTEVDKAIAAAKSVKGVKSVDSAGLKAKG
ncbi:MAG: BON domain-containing protein [Rhodanobacteraceae bacterium]